MKILKLQPCYKDYLWGGRKLVEKYNKHYSGDVLAETWELSCHPDGSSVIAEGDSKGLTLRDYIRRNGSKVLGKNCARFNDFPIMIKFIDAHDNLSVQVHPKDEYALKNEHQYGKTEMWYVLEGDEDAFLYYGFSKNISKEELQERIQNNTLTDVLNRVPVKKGDTFFIESGTVHAIGKGCVIAEIQENSNVTYRIYDYGRKDKFGHQRELHVDKALQVTNRNQLDKIKSYAPHLGLCKYFKVDKLDLDGEYVQSAQGYVGEESFLHILVTEGRGSIESDEKLSIQKGDSLFLPANIGSYTIRGNCELILTSIPQYQEAL